ncbi:MAG: serine kinase [Pseudomonadota bacterium]
MHASSVRIADHAVLVTGPSGSGKSSLCLELMALGATLIADDRTRLCEWDEKLWASAPKSLPQAIEARGVGLLRVRLAPAAPIGLVVDMGRNEEDRLPPERNILLQGHNVPLLRRSNTTHFAAAILLQMRGAWSQ